MERKYTLPENPTIVVQPSATAKGGKFDCTVMSLSLLLDYRPEDNKEHSFEVGRHSRNGTRNCYYCSTLTHSCEAWTITRMVVRMINGFNSHCLHAITGEDYRTTATVPADNLVLAVRKCQLRYLGHVLHLPAESIVRRSLLALVKGGTHYPEGSLFSDCEAALPQLEALSLDHSAWHAKVLSLT